MINEEKAFVLTNIDSEITGELNERFNDCVVNGSCDYEKGIITLEVAEPFEGEYLEEVEEIIELALPCEYETSYNIDGYNITITVGRELDEWEQDMKYSNYDSYEDQYYSTETSHIASLYGAIQSLNALYTTQPFAKEIEGENCLQSFYLSKKKEYLEELQQAFERFNGIVNEEEEQSMK